MSRPARNLAKTFEVEAAVVVLARMKDGQVANWKRLDEVWGLVGDKPAFAQFIRDEVGRMLAPVAPASALSPPGDASDIPIPDEGQEDVPLPTDPAKVPRPE